MTDHIPVAEYHALREQIQGILSEGKVHTGQAGDWEKVQTYWDIGDSLISHIDRHPRADYGERIVPNLSKDLHLSNSLLWDILLFRRLLTILPTYRELKWSHFREVIHLPGRDQRLFYLRAANRGSWNLPQLREAIEADTYGHAISQPLVVPPDDDPRRNRPLRARFGEFHAYRTVPSGNPASEEIYLDLGFHMTRQLEPGALSAPTPGLIVTPGANDRGSQVFELLPPNTRRFTYVAWIHRVIDGDTLIGVADLGLGLQTWPLRLRLRGIDTPELNTLAGQNARTFVQDALSQVDFVVIATSKTDTYGRYLIDLRYLPGETDPRVVRDRGIYLNRQLLTEYLALRYLG